MSLAAPEEASQATAFVCNKSESMLSVIEKCLDNGLGTCLIVEDDQRLVGRISLDDIRRGLVDGTAMVDPTLEWHLANGGAPATRVRDAPLRRGILPGAVGPTRDFTPRVSQR